MRQTSIIDNKQRMEEAAAFISACYAELGKSGLETERRLAEIAGRIGSGGSYEHTQEELSYGAKMAWRNSNRCIGRFFWETLTIQDARKAQTEEEIAEALLNHIEYATNGGKIRPLVTIFSPECAESGESIRIRNHQLIRYAGYETSSGIVGDPASVKFTALCHKLGWRGAGSAFDVLPLVIQIGGREPKWFAIPEHLVMRVPLVHPDLEGMEELGLEWYAVPIVSDMVLEIGGIRYTAAPFNGWYMGTEIGARNLADDFRYNMLPKVADKMGLDTGRDSSLWRDRALVELNVAVLHSFKLQGVTIVDHHTASKQFGHFVQKEELSGRQVTGRWSWLIPPLSPAATSVFHHRYEDQVLKPNFFHADEDR